jgi:valyl-tRNA synthetase
VTSARTQQLTLTAWPIKTDLTRERQALIAAADPFAGPEPLTNLLEPYFRDDAAEAEIGWVVDLVTAIRSVRAEMNIPPATLAPLVLAGASDESRARAQRWSDVIKRMSRLADISFADQAPAGAVQLLIRGEVAALPLKGIVDVAAQRTRLGKEIAKADADINRVDFKLADQNFIANAPEEIVEDEKEKREAAVARKTKFVEALERLKATE